MIRRVPKQATARARSLRNNATAEERALWRVLCRYRPAFTRQLPIGPYTADLANRSARAIVEVDGGQHAVQVEEDAARTAFLNQHGWTVIRLWNSDVRDNLEGCIQHILARTAECLGGTHPQPLPSREGRPRRTKR